MKNQFDDILQSRPGGVPQKAMFHNEPDGRILTRQLQAMGVDPRAFRRWANNSLLTGRAEIIDGFFTLKKEIKP